MNELELVNSFLNNLQLLPEAEQRYENLQIIPVSAGRKPRASTPQTMYVTSRNSDQTRIFTLDEAFENGVISIAEKPGGQSVEQLRAMNTSMAPILLLNGETLKGGGQNRQLAQDYLLAAMDDSLIPTKCVQKNRWQYDSPRGFKPANMSPTTMRMPTRSQGEVWNRAQQIDVATHTLSHTDCLDESIAHVEKEGVEIDGKKITMDDYLINLEVVENQIGYIAVVAGKQPTISIELFENTDLFKQYSEKIFKALIVDAIADYAGFNAWALRNGRLEATRDIFRGGYQLDSATTKPSGVAMLCDMQHQNSKATGLVYENRLLHFFSSVNSEDLESKSEQKEGVEGKIIVRERGKYPLKQGKKLTIGRDHNNDIQVQEARISRRHGVIIAEGDSVLYKDLDSLNGSYTRNGERVESVDLGQDTIVHLGRRSGPQIRYQPS